MTFSCSLASVREREATMPSGKKMFRKFMSHILTAPEGSDFEVGLTWDQANGWRVYQRVGDKALAMAPDAARKMAATYEKVGARPEWRGTAHGLEDTLGALRPLADEAEQKNRDRIIPDGAAAAMPAAGSA